MSGLIPRRELITASAGSGKTFQLTDRYIGLLLGGEDPESIVALTFSRKAAGEFFDAILEKLAKAASEEEGRAALNERLGIDVDASAYRDKLRGLLSVMHKLTLGTLDSFYHKILSRFPMEHGLGGDFRILDESTFQLQLGRALEILFHRGRSDPQLGENLGTAFRAARTGADDRAFAGWLVSLAEHYRSLRSLCHQESRWGASAAIWPAGAPWLAEDSGSFEADLETCRKMIEENELSDPTFTTAEQTSWQKAIDCLASWQPGEDLGKGPVLVERIFLAFRDWEGGAAEVLRKPKTEECFILDSQFADPLARLTRDILNREFARRMHRTLGAYGGLSANELVYNELVRMRGGLTFADIPLLLGQADPLERMQVEYRLDGSYRHWMLDEFQDTSPAQWRVLENLVEEAITDSSDSRAFFCVGDVKQAIYGWRGGDSRLFDLLRKNYEGRLTEDHLNHSWRSGPDVLGFVNDVFGSASGSFGFSASRWQGVWEEHQASKLTRDLPGQVAWWTSDDWEHRCQDLVTLLKELDPVRRGLRCAILTQKKQTGRDLADVIRRELPDLPVENEVGAKPGEDNPFSMALLSLLRAAAHPQDHFAHGHLGMTPLADLLPSQDDHEEWQDAMMKISDRVCQEGLEAVLGDWGARALDLVDPEARSFCESRLGHLSELARRFDETGSREIDAFVEYARGHEATSGSSEKSVRVMTIHRSKGLTFDVVILPELDGGALTSLRNAPRVTMTLHVQTAESGEDIDWVLDRPAQFFCQADATLNQVMEAARNEACFESLCKLYVAMTRPRQGLYLLSPPLADGSKAMNFLRLLYDTLDNGEETCREATATNFSAMAGDLRHARGTPAWYKSVEQSISTEIDPSAALLRDPDEFPASPAFRSATRKPSEGKGDTISGAGLFGDKRREALSLGTEVHELLEKIDWIEPDAVETFLAQADPSDEALDEIRRCLLDDATRALFVRPEEEVVLWREKDFCLMLDGRMVSGTFDRVVLRRAPDGSWLDATIIDFKTDRAVDSDDGLQTAVESHREQLELYHKALVRLTGLPGAKVVCQLLFTRVPCLQTAQGIPC